MQAFTARLLVPTVNEIINFVEHDLAGKR